jgi:glutaredoxin-dependent peroxiredoxin
MELLRDRSAEFEEAGVQRVGISRDSPWTHIAWTQALDLNFPLLSDWNAEAVRAFELGREFRGYKDIPVRSAFLVDTTGTIRDAWRYEDSEVPDFDALVGAAKMI